MQGQRRGALVYALGVHTVLLRTFLTVCIYSRKIDCRQIRIQSQYCAEPVLLGVYIYQENLVQANQDPLTVLQVKQFSAKLFFNHLPEAEVLLRRTPCFTILSSIFSLRFLKQNTGPLSWVWSTGLISKLLGN